MMRAKGPRTDGEVRDVRRAREGSRHIDIIRRPERERERDIEWREKLFMTAQRERESALPSFLPSLHMSSCFDDELVRVEDGEGEGEYVASRVFPPLSLVSPLAGRDITTDRIGRSNERREMGVCVALVRSFFRSFITQHVPLRNSRATHHPLSLPPSLSTAFFVLRECHESTCNGAPTRTK